MYTPLLVSFRVLGLILGIPDQSPKDGAIKARHFNSVLVGRDTVKKTSRTILLAGEAAYYEQVPEDLSDLFPRLLAKTETAGEDHLTIETERIKGLVCSQLLVNRMVDVRRLDSILQGLLKMHTWGEPEVLREDDCYSNYSRKVTSRYCEYSHLYQNPPTDTKVQFETISHYLKQYEASKGADVRQFIHGDPVFSNCIFSASGVKFIDMNGRQGQNITTEGDCNYDLAKVMQSLYGYDYIILEVDLDYDSKANLAELRDYFRNHVEKHYDVSWDQIQLLTASLFFSLIPLHDNIPHHFRLYELCKEVLQEAHSANAE